LTAVRDLGTFYLAVGAALVVAVATPRWRAPLLAVAALQYPLHTANHLLDLGEGESASRSAANLIALALGTVFLAVLAVLARREET
jgi:hypothetical protein